jgi:hypothetical protein
MQLPTTKAVTNGVNIGKPFGFFSVAGSLAMLDGETSGSGGRSSPLGTSRPLRLGVAKSVAIVRADRDGAQRKDGRQE